MKRLQILAAVGAYVAALLWAYATVVSPAFAYDGFALKWPSGGSMAWLITLSLLPALSLPSSLSKPSVLILWWLYLAAYIPSILIPALSLTMPFEELLPLEMSLLLCMAILRLASWDRVLAVGSMTLSPTVFWSVFTIVWLGGFVFIVAYDRGSILANLASLFLGANEYSIRGEYIAQLSAGGKALGYVVGQLGQALDPYLIAFGIVYRRRLCLIAGIVGQIVVFSLTGYKSILFSSLFLALLFAFTRKPRSFGMRLTTGLVAIVLLATIADIATKGVFFSTMITRRTLAAPGLLTGFYFEHFSQASHAGFGFRFARFAPPYFGPPQEIGLVYFGSANIDANANFWAEGFADFGIPGIVGFTLLVAFLIWIYDSIASSHSLELATLLAAMPALNLSNTAPTTVLVTHGGIAAALLLYLSPLRRPEPASEPAAESEFSAEQEFEENVAPAH
jgi:hypothetical protein